MKVKIKTWEVMQKEFGLTTLGNIDCDLVFLKEMEDALPKNRIIELVDGMWKGWHVSDDMIEYTVQEPNMKSIVGKALKHNGYSKKYRNEVMPHLDNAVFYQDEKLCFLKTDAGTGYALRNQADKHDAEKAICLAVTRIFKQEQSLKEFFIQFLKEQNCYDDFVCNLKTLEGESLDDHVDSMLKHKPIIALIEAAFIWISTYQGHNYWNKINFAWRKCFKKWEASHA